MKQIHIFQLSNTVEILKKMLIIAVNANQLDDNEKAVLVSHTEFYDSRWIRVLLRYSRNLHVSDECLLTAFHNIFHSVTEEFYSLNTCSRVIKINKWFTHLTDLQDEPKTWISANIPSKPLLQQYLVYRSYDHQSLDDVLLIVNFNFLALLHHRFVYKWNQEMHDFDENAKTASFINFVLNLCRNLCKKPSLNSYFLKLLPIIQIIKLCNKSLLHQGKSVYLLRHELSLIDPFIKVHKKIDDKNKIIQVKRTIVIFIPYYNKKEVKFTTKSAPEFFMHHSRTRAAF